MSTYVLSHWFIFRAIDRKTDHVVGVPDMSEHRISTAIATLDLENRRVVTRSGKVYILPPHELDKPCSTCLIRLDDAKAQWGTEGFINVTEEFETKMPETDFTRFQIYRDQVPGEVRFLYGGDSLCELWLDDTSIVFRCYWRNGSCILAELHSEHGLHCTTGPARWVTPSHLDEINKGRTFSEYAFIPGEYQYFLYGQQVTEKDFRDYREFTEMGFPEYLALAWIGIDMPPTDY